MLFGALFVCTLLLAALPAHRAARARRFTDAPATQSPEVDHRSMAGWIWRRACEQKPRSGHERVAITMPWCAHMTMTAMRAQTPEDVQRAKEVVAAASRGIEKYRLSRGR